MTVGLYCVMSVVFNAVTALQLKRVNNYWYSNIKLTFALSKVAFSFLALFSATYMLLLVLRHLYCRPCLLYFCRLLVMCVWHDLSDNFFVRQKSYDNIVRFLSLVWHQLYHLCPVAHHCIWTCDDLSNLRVRLNHRGLSKNRRDDGTTTGQDEASLPQLAAISCRRRVDGTAWQLTTGQVSI